MIYDRTRYNRLYAGELEDWELYDKIIDEQDNIRIEKIGESM